MATPQFASLVYYSEKLTILNPTFTLPNTVPGGKQGVWTMLGLPDIASRIGGSPLLYAELSLSGLPVRLWYALQIDVSSFPNPGTFQANFPTAKARKSALVNVITRWLEASSGVKWTAEDPVFFDDIVTILGTGLKRRWRADSGIALVAGGPPVSDWFDSVGAITLTEANPANQPDFAPMSSLVNNRPIVNASDNARDLLNLALPAQAQPFETFALVVGAAAVNGAIFSGNAPDVSELDLAGTASYTTDGLGILTDPVAVPASAVLFDTLANGLTSRLQLDDRAPIIGDAGLGAPTGFVMFNDSTQVNGAPVGIAELFAADPVTDDQRAAIHDYMAGTYRWNLPSP